MRPLSTGNQPRSTALVDHIDESHATSHYTRHGEEVLLRFSYFPPTIHSQNEANVTISFRWDFYSK